MPRCRLAAGGWKRTALAVAGAVLLSASRLAADEVELLSGIRLQGKVLHERAEDLVVEMGEGESRREVTISWEKVHAVTIGGQRRLVREKAPAPVPASGPPNPPGEDPDLRISTGGPPPVLTARQPAFVRPTPEEALAFLKSLPRVWRNTRDFNPKGPSQKILVQLWENCTVEDLKTMRVIHPGGHIEDPEAPNRFSQRHLRIRPGDWKYFTVFEQAEAFVVGHDIEGITDECLFHLGHLPQSVSRIQLAMSEATGEGVRHLANLKNLRSLSLNFSKNMTDVALVHAAEISALEYLDVNGCPGITGSGVAALARLRNLKVLKIGGCSLSDASLQHFKDLSIEELDLSDNVAEWVVRYRGGGRHNFTVTFAGLKALLADKANLPDLKHLIAGRDPKSLLKGDILSKNQKAELARIRPGLQVR